MSKAQKGKKMPESAKQLLREINLGKVTSESTKKKQSAANKNRVVVNNGIITKKVHVSDIPLDFIYKGWPKPGKPLQLHTYFE